MIDNVCKFLAESFSADFANWILGEAITLTKIEPSELSIEPIRADSVIFLESIVLVQHNYVDNPYNIQEVYNESQSGLKIPRIKDRIERVFKDIEKAHIPYHLREPNSNSSAFQSIRSIEGIPHPNPPSHIIAPAWELNPFDYAP